MRLALYLHVPFCRSKCPYCDFYSVTKMIPEKLYLRALLQELTLWEDYLEEEPTLVTFYAGGGTPSLLSPQFYARLFEYLAAHFRFEPKELTLEANPEGLTLERLRAYRGVGFNRLSLGVQSFLEKGLRALGRRHRVAEAMRAIEAARQAGFDNLSLDLIFGWPEETLKDLETDVKTALSLKPEHLSFYELTPEPGTPLSQRLARREISLPPEDLVADMYLHLHTRLTEAGFEHYEISNYARPGRECLHNLFYWQSRDYLGLGPSAVSFVRGKRFRNPPDLTVYLQEIQSSRLAAKLEEDLDTEGLFREAVVLGLRLLRGLSARELKARFGRDLFQVYAREIAELERLGLLERTPEGIRLSLQGLLLANQVQSRFI